MYQRLVTKIFMSLIGRTIEVYMENMITKSKDPVEDAKYLEKAFKLLIKYKVKLNPKKCIFGVSSGEFLGFTVSH